MCRDRKGEALSCIRQIIPSDDHEGPYPSIGFDLPVSEITDDDETSDCTSGEGTRVQLDLSWLSSSVQSLEASNELIRACHVSDLLAGNGSFLADGQDSQESFSISKWTNNIDFFISHNWSMHHKYKLRVLKIWFGGRRAFVCSVLACLPTAALILSGSLPGWKSRRAILEISWSPLCLLIGILAFISSMRFSCKRRHFFFWSCGEAQTCFYDRVCINQKTAELKRAGILKLPAILNASRNLLVLHSQAYFNRLWTCFEFCSFLIVKGPENVRILPANYPVMCAEISLSYTLYILSKSFSFTDMFGFQRVYVQDRYVAVLFDKFFLLVFLCVLFRQSWQWIGTLLWAKLQLSRLKMPECCCADESDRPIVEGHLVFLAKRKALVDENASHEDSLAAFELFVRKQGTSIINIHGGTMVSYPIVVGACVASILDGIDVLAWSAQSGLPIGMIARNFLTELAFPFFVAPISFRAYLHAAANLRARRHVGRAGLALIQLCVPGVLGAALENMGYTGRYNPRQPYIDSDLAFYIYIGVLFIVTAIIYSPFEFKRWFWLDV